MLRFWRAARMYLLGLGSAVTLLFLLLFTFPHHTSADNEHIVSIHHDGLQQTVVTDATTVGEVLKRLHISLAAQDIVEPSPVTKLNSPSYDINIYRARPVMVVDGETRQQVMTAHTSATAILKDAGTTVYPEDTTDLTRIDNFVTEGGIGLRLTITRATPIIFVQYGTPVSLRTQSQTVGDLLRDKNVKLGPQDGTNLPLNTPIASGLTIKVWRDGVQTVTETHDVPFAARRIQDANQPLGFKLVQTPGTLGKKLVTFQVTTKGGQETSRAEIQSVVTVQPIEQVEVIGVKPPIDLNGHKTELMSAVGIAEGDWPYVDYILTRESGWCPTKLQGHPGACPAIPPDAIPAGLGYGLCQSTPGSKMATAGADWQTNAVTQLRWCNSYALSRYGSWLAAYNHWIINHNW